MVDGFGTFRILAYYQYGISELAVRDIGHDCGAILRMDMAKNGIDIRFGASARSR